MGSNGDKKDSTKAESGIPKNKVNVKELQNALNVLAKYGIISNRKELLEKTGFGMTSNIVARVRGPDGKIKKTYEYENGILMEEK